MIRAFALALVGAAFATGARAANPDEIAHTYAEAGRQLDQHSDGFALDATKDAQDALIARWSLPAEWVAAMLDSHPDAAPEELATMALNGPVNTKLTALDPDSWLAVTGRGDFGSFAIIARRDGHFVPVWFAWRDPGDQFPSLAAWKPEGAQTHCPDMTLRYSCGPIHGSATLLPRDSHGHARFLIDAARLAPMGTAEAGQVSVWRWDGQAAEPLAVVDFAFMADQKLVTRFDGHFIRIREKASFKTFYGCGACLGRQVDHILRLDADGVRDMGRVSVTPELDAIDAAFYRLYRSLPVDGLASPKAARVMESILRDTSEPGENGHDFSLGMLTSDSLLRKGAATELCFSADRTSPYIFTLRPQTGRGARLFIADARPGPCTGFPDSP